MVNGHVKVTVDLICSMPCLCKSNSPPQVGRDEAFRHVGQETGCVTNYPVPDQRSEAEACAMDERGRVETTDVVDNTAVVVLSPSLFESLVATWTELLVADFRRRHTGPPTTTNHAPEFEAVSL